MSNLIAHNTAKEVVYALSKKYGFDSGEAWEHAMTIAEVKNAMEEKTSPSESDTSSSNEAKIAACRKNIELWEKKLDEGKVKDTDKHIEKIEKEKKKLQKLEGSDTKPDAKPEGKTAAKKAEPKADEKKKKDDSESDTSSSNESKIAACRKNIELWQKKLDEGKVKDTDKQLEKIEKEKKKLQKSEGSDAKSEAKPEGKTAEKKAEPKEEPKAEKRIKRFSPVMSSQLKAILADVDVEITEQAQEGVSAVYRRYD
jgi:hypothetical protein